MKRKLSALAAAVALLAVSASPAMARQTGEDCKPWDENWPSCYDVEP